MARISSQNTKVYIGNGGAVTPLTVTAISKAKPAVLTGTGFTVQDGNLVTVSGTGFKSLDGRTFRADSVSATEVTLLGSDTTNEAGTANVASDVIEAHGTTEVCLATFARNGAAAARIDVTTMCDDARRRVPGLPDLGSFRFDGMYDATDSGYAALRAFYAAGGTRPISVVAQDGSSITFKGSITSLSESFGVDQAATFSGEGDVDGAVIYATAP